MFTSLMTGKVQSPEDFFTTVVFENSAQVRLHADDFWDDLARFEQEMNAGGPADSDPAAESMSDVSMTWNLTRAEQRALQRAIPSDPVGYAQWSHTSACVPGQGCEHDDRLGELQGYLAGQVFETLKPGRERDLRAKRLEQLRNYIRLQNLRVWWKSPDVGRRIEPPR